MQTKRKPRGGPGRAAKGRAGLSAQQTIPYIAMHPDGVCQLPGGVYTKTVEYEDINYSVASTEDQTAIFGGWSSFLNYFDSSLPFQLSFINRRSRDRSRYKVNIPPAEDEYNSIREEFTGMLKNQIAKSNNGIERSKYITFGLPAEGVAEARPRLERVEADVMGNLHRLGVQSLPLDGRDRLALLHGQMHPGSHEPFRFSWKDIPKTGLGTKDYIAPDSFDFRDSRTFRVYYDYYICYVTLENFNLSHVPVYMMGEEQLSRYALYMSTLGNRPDLFPQSGYVPKYTNPAPEHDVPESYLADETFASILTEAEKYLGFPYVWGGSSPNTSFDCSGFVSYVYNQCGWDFGRLGAQGLYNISTRTNSPKPGDLVFFTGTYDTPGVSHCGIYVGDGWMLHCGDPVQYANLNSSYWQSHFYAYGKLY